VSRKHLGDGEAPPVHARAGRWLEENRDAIAAINAFIDDHGLLVPRTRSSHNFRGGHGCELRVQKRH